MYLYALFITPGGKHLNIVYASEFLLVASSQFSWLMAVWRQRPWKWQPHSLRGKRSRERVKIVSYGCVVVWIYASASSPASACLILTPVFFKSHSQSREAFVGISGNKKGKNRDLWWHVETTWAEGSLIGCLVLPSMFSVSWTVGGGWFMNLYSCQYTPKYFCLAVFGLGNIGKAICCHLIKILFFM